MEGGVGPQRLFDWHVRRGCMWHDFLRLDAAVTLVKVLDLLAAVGRPLCEWGGACRSRTSRTSDRDALGSAGTVMREIVEAGGTAARPS